MGPGFDNHRNTAASGGEFSGVIQQIGHDLKQTSTVRNHGLAGEASDIGPGDLDGGAADNRIRRGTDIGEKFPEIEGLSPDGDPAQFHAGEIQQVVDQAHKSMAVTVDGVEVVETLAGQSAPIPGQQQV